MMKGFLRQCKGYLKWSSRTKAPIPHVFWLNKHFSSTIVCIHYMSGHWKLSLDFLKCFSNEKLNLKEWRYHGTLPLLSLVWETKSLNTLLWLYSLTISGCLGNFFMWSFRRLSSGGKVWGLSANPSSAQTLPADPERPAAVLRKCVPPELRNCFILTIYYFTLLRNCDIPDSCSRTGPTVICSPMSQERTGKREQRNTRTRVQNIVLWR